jgi:hypothetical protein
MDYMNLLRQLWDRALAWVAIGIGALVLLIGWLGVSREILPAAQIPYIISGGLGGLFFLGVGAVLWISADLRDEWRQLREIATKLDVQENGKRPVTTRSASQAHDDERLEARGADGPRPRVPRRTIAPPAEDPDPWRDPDGRQEPVSTRPLRARRVSPRS